MPPGPRERSPPSPATSRLADRRTSSRSSWNAAACGGGVLVGRDDAHLAARRQPELAVGHHAVAADKAAGDQRRVFILRAQGDLVHLHGVVGLDHINEWTPR